MRRLIFLLVIVLPFAAWYDQNFRIRIRRTQLPHAAVEQSVTIVHISDLHGMNWGDGNEPLLRMIASEKPDLICVTGDMYTRGMASEQQIAEKLISELCHLAPVFFVPGEHDRDPSYLQSLVDSGALIPGQRGISLKFGGTDLVICGCSRAWFPENADLSKQYDSSDPDSVDILLCHIPVPQAFAGSGFDLMLSGDTHGGVIRLPWLGTLFDGDRWLPELRNPDACFIHGTYFIGAMTLSVTSGLGGPPVRFGAPPEISVIRLIPFK